MIKDLIGLTHNDWCEIQLPRTYQKVHTQVKSLGVRGKKVVEVSFMNGSSFNIDGTPLTKESGTFIKKLRPRDIMVSVNGFVGKITRERVNDYPQLSHIRLFYSEDKFIIIPTDSCIHDAENIINVISAQDNTPNTHKRFVINTELINVVSLCPSGDINITLTDVGKSTVFLMAYENFSVLDIIKALFDSLDGTELSQVDPDDVGALTDSPMLGFTHHRDNEGNTLNGYDRVWWFPNYQIENEVTELLSHNGWTMAMSDLDNAVTKE